MGRTASELVRVLRAQHRDGALDATTYQACRKAVLESAGADGVVNNDALEEILGVDAVARITAILEPPEPEPEPEAQAEVEMEAEAEIEADVEVEVSAVGQTLNRGLSERKLRAEADTLVNGIAEVVGPDVDLVISSIEPVPDQAIEIPEEGWGESEVVALEEPGGLTDALEEAKGLPVIHDGSRPELAPDADDTEGVPEGEPLSAQGEAAALSALPPVLLPDEGEEGEEPENIPRSSIPGPDKRNPVPLIGAVAVIVVLGVLGWRAWNPAPEPFGQPAGIPAVASTPGSVRVEFRIDEGVVVVVDGEPIGSGPTAASSLLAGTHQVSYSYGGAQLYGETIELSEGDDLHTVEHLFLATVALRTTPVDAGVVVDGEIDSNATSSFVRLAPGSHSFSISAPCYEPATENVDLSAGEHASLAVDLELSDPGSLRIAVPPGLTGVEVFSNDASLGFAPLQIELPPGQQSLEYRYQGMSQRETHAIECGQVARYTVALRVDRTITAIPWAEVFAVREGAEISLGTTPIANAVVRLGERLIFRHPDFPELEYTVTPGEEQISARMGGEEQ